MYIKQGANCNGGTQVKMLLVTLLHFFLSYQNLSLWNLTLLNLLNWINLLNAYLFVRHFLADAEQNSQLVLPHKISLIFLWLFTFSKAVLTCFSGRGGGASCTGLWATPSVTLSHLQNLPIDGLAILLQQLFPRRVKNLKPTWKKYHTNPCLMQSQIKLS